MSARQKRAPGLALSTALPPMGQAMAAGLKPRANDRQIGGDHYKRAGIQVWDAVIEWNLGFLDGNVIKYVARFRLKGGLEDLYKARHYLDKLIEREEAKPAP